MSINSCTNFNKNSLFCLSQYHLILNDGNVNANRLAAYLRIKLCKYEVRMIGKNHLAVVEPIDICEQFPCPPSPYRYPEKYLPGPGLPLIKNNVNCCLCEKTDDYAVSTFECKKCVLANRPATIHKGGNKGCTLHTRSSKCLSPVPTESPKHHDGTPMFYH